MKYASALGTTAKQAIEKSAWDLIISDGEELKDLLARIFETKDKKWVENVLEGNSLVCSEDILFDAIAHWACHQIKMNHQDCEDLTPDSWNNVDDEEKSQNGEYQKEVESLLSDISHLVRFPTMPAEYVTSNGLIA